MKPAFVGDGDRHCKRLPFTVDQIRAVLQGRVESDPGVRSVYVGAMAELGRRTDLELLRSLAEDDPSAEVRAAATRGVRRLEEILLSNPER